MPVKIPIKYDIIIEAHNKWLKLVQEAQALITTDVTLQRNAAKGLRIKERNITPEVIGRMYAQYCDLINRMYEAYLASVHLQRAEYMKSIITVFMKRLYELRNELVHIIVNDYIYVDAALMQMKITPEDIEIVVPCHYAVEARPGSMEELLQQMYADAQRRKMPVSTKSIVKPTEDENDEDDLFAAFDMDMEDDMPPPDVKYEESIPIPEEFIHSVEVQRMERFRQFYLRDYRAKSMKRKIYFVDKTKEARKSLKIAAAMIIQTVYRKYMEIKRQHVKNTQLDMLLGMIPDPWHPHLDLAEETQKLYLRKHAINEKSKQIYLEEMEREKYRLIYCKKDDEIEDITGEIRDWFREWFYGYGFFPEYPWPEEGGTVMLIRGEYPTIEEKIDAEIKYAQQMKGKTKDMLRAEKEQAKFDAILKAEAEAEMKKKMAESLFKARCNPFGDPGYEPKTSDHMGTMTDLLINYSELWSIYDNLPPERFGEVVYGFMKPIMQEDLMCQLHKECRQIVDELMRLEMKLLIAAHQYMYNLRGEKFPKMKPRKRPPPPPPPPKEFVVDDDMTSKFGEMFDLGLVTRPKNKLQEIIGDSNYAAYDLNIRDPDASFPPPGYGDIRRRLKLSCIFGCGIEPGAKRNKAVLLLGEPRNGKSFLVNCVAGEINAIKIDISPEVLSAEAQKPAKTLTQVFIAAKVFQPCVIFLKNIERVFMKKVPPEQKYLKAKSIKKVLVKCVKGISAEDKIIFIATCSSITGYPAGPMVSLFSEIILVPRPDYGSLRKFFYNKLQSVRSMPRDFCVQPLAQCLQGFGFGSIIEVYDTVMTSERIVRMNVEPLSPAEFLEVFLEAGIEPRTMADYKEFVEFHNSRTPLAKEREEYVIINKSRKIVYTKMKKAEDKKKKEGN